MATFTNNLLQTILKELKYFENRNGLPCNFILLHEDDTPQLVKEMVAAKMMPKDGQTEKIVIESARVIRTRDIRQGTVMMVLN